ncbi:subunit 17 of mediator complex-domain-containing protein [Clohesyomyces aquaticus]|uniref:Mediator of RNA polymerase II transcription subunit 17 n=1 Tax=Clohesyomyces aquaticus TaxID=1231657 RepID=A0A1Y1YY42_9PLEO|nr:subunit 17 of mediator complex-domain-containing protein [Clohesyomyces aquaticus]
MSASGSVTNVALRPWPTSSRDKLTPLEIHAQIAQLTTERGHLRYITEESLQNEIDTGTDPSKVAKNDAKDDKEKGAPTRQERLMEIQATGRNMYTKLEWSTFWTSNMIDLISLILSKDPSKRVDGAFSARFKEQNIPHGSYGLDKGSSGEENDKGALTREAITLEKKKRRLVGMGSRMEALDKGIDDILAAANELETEVRKETRYWSEILSVSEKGWSLQKLRKDAPHSPFAVHYGFQEASDHFKARRMAPLRMDKDGGIILDPALSLKPKTLRVRVTADNKVLGTAALPPTGDLSDLGIEKSIQLARDSLFEEELYHEMSMERRQLGSFGVQLRDSCIHLPVPDLAGGPTSKTILIDLVARDERPVDDYRAMDTGDHAEDWLAEKTAEALRTLLSHEHHMRGHRRAQIPPPLTQHRRQNPAPPLLRTVLTFFHHTSAVNVLQKYLDRTTEVLNSAGLVVSGDIVRETSWAHVTDTIHTSQASELSAVDRLIEGVLKPFDGVATLTLPSSNKARPEQINVTIRTYMGAPIFGAEYKVTLPPSLGNVLDLPVDHPREFRFTSTPELESYLDWIISLDLAHTLVPREYGARAIIADMIPPRVSIWTKEGKEGIKKDLAVELERGIIKLNFGIIQTAAGPTGGGDFSWDGAQGAASFREKVKEFTDPK